MGGSKDEHEEVAYDDEAADEEDDEAEGDGDWGAALRGARFPVGTRVFVDEGTAPGVRDRRAPSFFAIIPSHRRYGVKPLEVAARATRSRARFPPALGQQSRRAALCADAAAGQEGGPGVHRCAGVDAQQCTVDFLGGNHTRNLPVVAFVSREQRNAQGRAPTASSTTGSPNAMRGM